MWQLVFFLFMWQSLFRACDRVWENPPYSYFRKIAIALYLSSTTLELSLRPIARSVPRILRPLSDHARTIKLDKLQSKGVAMRTHPISVYYKCTEIECVNAWRRERQGYDLLRRLSADHSKRASVSQLNRRTRRL